MEIHKDLAGMKVIAVLQAIEHGCKYNLIIHNPVDGKFDIERSTYETVMDSYFEKERLNVARLTDTDKLLEEREQHFDPGYLKLIRDKEIEMNNIKIFSAEPMKITNPYRRENEEPFVKPEQVINVDPKTHRNDKCPCGSGRKFKHCCATFK